MNLRSSIVVTVALVGVGVGLVRADDKVTLKAGDAAPDFKVKDHTGKEVKLADLKGKRFVLWFFPKAETKGCTIEGCGFRDLAAEFEKKKVVVYGVSFDKEEANAAFVKNSKFPFALLCDTDKAVAKAYGAWDAKKPDFAQRNTYVVSPEGKIEKVYTGVNPMGHPKEVLEAIPAPRE
jgi:peroxiredoxin Q/BCP